MALSLPKIVFPVDLQVRTMFFGGNRKFFQDVIMRKTHELWIFSAVVSSIPEQESQKCALQRQTVCPCTGRSGRAPLINR